MKNLTLLTMVFALQFCSVSCGHLGADITACTIDAEGGQFECASGNNRFALSFKDGHNLGCMSPMDLEDVLKACKQHQKLEATMCQLDGDFTKYLTCYPPDNRAKYSITIAMANSYFCLSQQDYKRVQQRCK